MNKKDPNYIPALEKAVKEKYGDLATQNPKHFWDEQKEKEFLEQQKEFSNKKYQNEESREKYPARNLHCSCVCWHFLCDHCLDDHRCNWLR